MSEPGRRPRRRKGRSIPCVVALKEAVKRRLPEGRKVRVLRFGIGRGLRLGLDLHDGDIGTYLGLYEVELSRHLRALAFRGAKCFDLGGNLGYDALVLAKLTGGPVVSVERDARLAAELRANADRNPSVGPVVVVTAEVSSTTSATSITIDELAAQHFVPDLIKIDIEGGELEALRGAQRTLMAKPSILLEVHGEQLEWDCLELLRAAGYAPPVVVDRRRWLPEHRPLAHNRWLVLRGSSAVSGTARA